MSKKITITRKIQLNIDYPLKSEQLDNAYKTLYAWQRIVHRAANLIATHNFMQDKIKDMIYLTEEVKVKLADVAKDEAGILNTSKMNSTYRILSDEFKGEIPTAILSSLNQIVTKTYNEEKKEYFTGQRSLRSYRRDIPIPFQAKNMLDFRQVEKDFAFTLYKIPFKTFLGIDKSNNRTIIESVLAGEYKLCDSSIKIEKNKLFLLMVIQFDKTEIKLDAKKEIVAKLDTTHPIIANFRKKEFIIGNSSEYIYRRQAIQAARQKRQTAAKYNHGGRGRVKKLKGLDYFEKKEKNYVETKMHQYSFQLIRLAIKQKCKTIKIINIPDSQELAEKEPFLLRNWSYYGLIEKIKYKAAKWGVEVIEE